MKTPPQDVQALLRFLDNEIAHLEKLEQEALREQEAREEQEEERRAKVDEICISAFGGTI